ncbi:MAG: hypothetical protein U0441_33430 [Polyangiaceae bacterium]
MNDTTRLGWKAFSARLCATSALAAVLATGCSDGGGGSGGGGSTSSGGTTASGGTGGATAGSGGTTGGTGGTGGALPTCDETQTNLFHVTMGFQETGTPWSPPEPGPATSVTVSGTVSDVGIGPLPVNCGSLAKGASGLWLSVVDADGKSWTACYNAPGASMPVASGDVIDVTYDTATGGLGSYSLALTVRKQSALVLLAFQDSYNDLTLPPEISIENGEQVCVGGMDSYCVLHGYKAVVTVGGEQSEMLGGDTSTVGAYDIHLGRWNTVAQTGVCDGPASEHELFAVPATAP